MWKKKIRQIDWGSKVLNTELGYFFLFGEFLETRARNAENEWFQQQRTYACNVSFPTKMKEVKKLRTEKNAAVQWNRLGISFPTSVALRGTISGFLFQVVQWLLRPRCENVCSPMLASALQNTHQIKYVWLWIFIKRNESDCLVAV